MKRAFIILLVLFLFCPLVKSQITSSVEESIFNIQTGLLGVWVNHEQRLTNQITLRSEIGFDGQLWGGSIYQDTNFAFQPIFSLETRWYSNIAKRQLKGKTTDNNSANFKGLQISYRPDLFVISSLDNAIVIPDLFIAPTIGLRRPLLKVLNFEAGCALGWQMIYYRNAGFGNNTGGLAFKGNLRIGYTF